MESARDRVRDAITESTQPPVRLCCGQRHVGVQCPDGLVMCCLCFKRFPVEGLSVDPNDGKPWDVCIGCRQEEQARAAR